MRYLRWWLVVFIPVLGLTFAGASGCKEKPQQPVQTGEGEEEEATETKAAQPFQLAGYAKSLKGRVIFTGAGGEAGPTKKKIDKDHDACTKHRPDGTVPEAGWYVNEKNKGIQYAVIFLRPPQGYKMPDPEPALMELPKDKDGKPIEFAEMRQPHCQFEPRVLVLHPKQKIRFLNDSNPPIAHDSSLQGRGFSLPPTTMPAPKPGEPPTKREADPPANDRQPYKVTCNIHVNFMSAWVWKMSHPYATVTDIDGNFELKGVPVPKAEKTAATRSGDVYRVAKAGAAASPAPKGVELWVWHEMLPGRDKMKKITTVEIGVGEEKDDIEIKLP